MIIPGAFDRVPAEEVASTLKELLRGTRWGEAPVDEEPGFLVRWISDFFDWLGGLFSSEEVTEGAAVGSKVFLAIVITFALLVLAWLLLTLARERQLRESNPSPEGGELAHRVEVLRGEAREAERLGDWTRALRLYFFATVVGLGERGDLEYRDAWTNRELLERGDPRRAAREELLPLVGELDEHSFGRRPTDADEVRRFSTVCDRLLGGEA